MYGGLSQLLSHVHGNHDAVHEKRQDGHEDDGHVHGLHGDVHDVRQWDDAHVSNEWKDVHDVLRDVHNVRGHVREHGRQSNDEALRRDVPSLCRVLLDERQVDEGCIGPKACAQQARGQRTLPPNQSADVLAFKRGFSANP